MRRKFADFLAALWSFIRYGDVPLQEHDRRQRICLECPKVQVTQAGLFCLACKCPRWVISDLRTKWRMRVLKCPLEKW